MRTILVDAGPLIALFAADDRHHARYRDLILESDLRGLRFVTTWPCIVEASYLLATVQRLEMLAFVEAGGIQVFPFDVGPSTLTETDPVALRKTDPPIAQWMTAGGGGKRRKRPSVVVRFTK